MRIENEIGTLEEIFCEKPLWKGKYPLYWCELCDTFSISCPEEGCGGSSCNAHGCEKCNQDIEEFHKIKQIRAYLNEDEKKIYQKIFYLKRYIFESLKRGESEINWKYMKENGELCGYAEKIFEKEINEKP